MSFDYGFSFGPVTPPHISYEEALNDASFINPHHGHSRSSSHASIYSQESSLDTFNTQLATPARSPTRQLGPLLLPKIRPQDQEIKSPPKIMKKTPVSKVARPFRPSHTRSYTNPEAVSFMTNDNLPSHTRSMSTLCSPISFTTSESSTDRRASSADILDGQTPSTYAFPTYHPMPTYTTSTNPQIETFISSQNYYQIQSPHRTPSPLQNAIYLEDMTTNPLDDTQTTTLSAYLTSQNPAPALVRQINVHVRDATTKHFWWDIRQIRPWTSFSTSTIARIPGLYDLLSISLPSSSFPIPSKHSSAPETEAELASIYAAFYSTKLNAALSISQGQRHLVMRSPKTVGGSDPTFISNYTDDTSQLIYGRGLGRVVGLVKSFDRWNTGMRVEGNHRKVEYLRGLAHLHHCMRTNGCRYGFILTEIELVVVRNGAENTPHFGYLELQTVQLAAHSQEGEGEEEGMKMTALMALWYLHMLARDEALPGQTGWKSEIGAPAEGTRRKHLPKDEWIPEPQLAEKREGKRCRGWVWPEEPVGRKELGKRGVRYGC